MMAYERLEPFGALHDELMAGAICAVMANVHRDPKAHPEPYKASDFMASLGKAIRGAVQAPPLLLDDPEEQARLIKQAIFGVKDRG